MRDYNGMRGAIPGPWRAHDWQTQRLLAAWADFYRSGHRPRSIIWSHGRGAIWRRGR